MYKWFLAWRYLHTKLIAFFGIASVMLCVAMVLIVMSVMGGFLDTVRERSRGLHAEIVVDNGTLRGFPYYNEFAAYVQKELPDVVRVTTPVIWTYGIFRVPRTEFTNPTRVLGVELDKYVQVNDFKRGLYYEKYFPGTTTLGLQQMPVGGFNEKDEVKLPPDLEAAHAKWRSEADPEEIAKFDHARFGETLYPRQSLEFPADLAFSVSAGDPSYEGREAYGIIVGCDLLNPRRPDGNFDRMYVRGTDIALTLVPLSPSGNPLGEPPIRLPLRYTDDSRTGIYEIDSMAVYVDFHLLQHQLAMDAQTLADGGHTEPRANQLLIGLQKGLEINEAKAMIAAKWEDFRVSIAPDISPDAAELLSYAEVLTWEDLQRSFIQAVEKEKVLVTLLFSLISMVAIVLIGCIFYMIVEKKTRDIGILKALGASGRGVAGLFIAYAGAVGIVGSILGILFGCVFVWNINGIQDWLATLNPQLRVWSPDVYSFDRIPEVVKRADAIWVAAIAVVSSMVGSLIPAFIAARVWPVRALRYE